MAGNAEDSEVGDVIGATLGDWDQVVALPGAWLESGGTHLATAVSSLEPVPAVPRILRVFVVLPVGVAQVADLFVDFGGVELAVVPLSWSSAGEAGA